MPITRTTLVLAALLLGCAHPPPDAASGAAEVEASGALHAVWNGESRYFLVSDDGTSIALIVTEETDPPASALLELNRRRVTVRGEYTAEGALRVRQIRAASSP